MLFKFVGKMVKIIVSKGGIVVKLVKVVVFKSIIKI